MNRCVLYVKEPGDVWRFVATDHYCEEERLDFRDAAKRFEESDLSFGWHRQYRYVRFGNYEESLGEEGWLVYIDLGAPPALLTDEQMSTYKGV